MIINLFYITIFLILGYERSMGTFGKKKVEGKKYSGWLTYLLLINYISCMIAGLIEVTVFIKNPSIFLTITGILTYILGTLIRHKAIKTLDTNWSFHTKEIKDQKLILTEADILNTNFNGDADIVFSIGLIEHFSKDSSIGVQSYSVTVCP